MILQALTDYYEDLAAQGRIARPGWAKVKVSWALELGENGELLDVLPLRSPSADGKKMLPREMELPVQMKRSGNKAPSYYLCDNLKYALGIEHGAVTEKSKKAFQQFKELHEKRLSEIDDTMARAVVGYVTRYTPEELLSLDIIKQHQEMLDAEGNCVFISPNGEFAHERPSIIQTVNNDENCEAYTQKQVCLITGKQAEIARIHNSVRGRISGNSPNGWTLVSFDKDSPAYDSYGKKQGFNAPVSKYAAFAYTSALAQLLSDREHVKLIGDTTVVYWAKDAQEQYQDLFAVLLDGSGGTVTGRDLDALIGSIAAGKPYEYDGLPIDPENEFFILGLSPNAARLSVRFFYRSSFGALVRHVKQHYEDIRIVSDGRSPWRDFPLWALLRETVNQKASDKSPLPQLAGDVMKSMLSGGRYPETLMNQTMLRIRAEHEITRGKAGIVKAWLIRNTKTSPDRDRILEVTQVALNTESSYTPYVLGRLFAVLEAVQQAANPGINATIKDRFFNSACATPASVFPILLKLSNSHLKKMETGSSVYWSRQIAELAGRLDTDFPAHLSLQEQGAFILGYYHQTQKRFEKKTNTNKETE